MAVNLSTLSSTGDQGAPSAPGDFYISMATWEAAAQDNHGAGDQSILECYKGTTTEGLYAADGAYEGTVVVDGWANLTATDYCLIRPAAGNEHNGVVGQGFIMRQTSGTTTIIALYRQYMIVDGLQATNTGSGFASFAVFIGQRLAEFKNCIVTIPNSPDGTNNCYRGAFNGALFWNCLGIGGKAVFDLKEGSPCEAYSCTALGAIDNAYQLHTQTLAYNCVAFNNGSTNYTSITADPTLASNNASEDGTAPGTSPIHNIDSSAFVNFAGGDYTPATGGVLDGTGADLSSSFTDDITGYERTPPWDVGAYAIQAAAPYTFDGPNIIAQTGTDGTPYTFQDGGDGDVSTRFSAAGTYALAAGSDALPAGMTIDPTTGNPEGTPTEVVTRNIIIEGTES